MARPRTRTDYLDLDTIAAIKRFLPSATEAARVLGIDLYVMRRALGWKFLTPQERQDIEAAWARFDPVGLLASARTLRDKLAGEDGENTPAPVYNEAMYVARRLEQLVEALRIEDPE